MGALTPVLILGYGEMGRAMESLLAGRAKPTIWTRRSRPGHPPTDLLEAAGRHDILLFCLPTFPHGEILERLLPVLPSRAICLSVAKGLDDSGRPVSRILTDTLGDQWGCGVLHGPMIAEEILAGRHAFAELGHRGEGVADRVLALFAGSRLHVTPHPDMTGINWAVILKNVYAMAFGMADELGLGDNVRGWLAATSLRELDGIVQRLGGKPGTALGLAGLGDLMTTATSEHSHHHELGRRLARGETRIGVPGGIEGEAIRTLTRVEQGQLFDAGEFPLFRWILGLVKQPGDVGARFETLLREGAGEE
jgi:glycerol-3-phosphate dehydrogenase (NAD(P)+)